QAAYGWPRVNAMDELAGRRKGVRVSAARAAAIRPLMEAGPGGPGGWGGRGGVFERGGGARAPRPRGVGRGVFPAGGAGGTGSIRGGGTGKAGRWRGRT